MVYYVIEKYETETGYHNTSKAYDVRQCATKSELVNAIKKGPLHGGTLIIAKGLEYKIQIADMEEECENNMTDFNNGLAEQINSPWTEPYR